MPSPADTKAKPRNANSSRFQGSGSRRCSYPANIDARMAPHNAPLPNPQMMAHQRWVSAVNHRRRKPAPAGRWAEPGTEETDGVEDIIEVSLQWFGVKKVTRFLGYIVIL